MRVQVKEGFVFQHKSGRFVSRVLRRGMFDQDHYIVNLVDNITMAEMFPIGEENILRDSPMPYRVIDKELLLSETKPVYGYYIKEYLTEGEFVAKDEKPIDKRVDKMYLVKTTLQEPRPFYANETGTCIDVIKSKQFGVMLKLELTNCEVWFNEKELEEF